MINPKILNEQLASRVEYQMTIDVITDNEMRGCSVHVGGQRPYIQVMDLLDTWERRELPLHVVDVEPLGEQPP